jgi:uncharacterized membrane protein YdjX (TVP38/TMEM64 family)
VRAAWKPALMLAGLAGLGLALRTVGFDPRGAVEAAGRQGPIGFVLIGTLACAAALPRQVVALAGGYAFGFWPGCALALVAEMLGCAVDFYWARLLGRRAASAFIDRREGGRLHRLDRFLAERAFTATLTLRLLPFGNNFVLNLLAGVSGVAAAPFLAASLFGYVPQTVVFALAGAGASLSDGAQLGLAVALLAASIGLGFVLLRRRPVPA